MYLAVTILYLHTSITFVILYTALKLVVLSTDRVIICAVDSQLKLDCLSCILDCNIR